MRKLPHINHKLGQSINHKVPPLNVKMSKFALLLQIQVASPIKYPVKIRLQHVAVHCLVHVMHCHLSTSMGTLHIICSPRGGSSSILGTTFCTTLNWMHSIAITIGTTGETHLCIAIVPTICSTWVSSTTTSLVRICKLCTEFLHFTSH
eukprot:Gb_37371 [translate_table: standard]